MGSLRQHDRCAPYVRDLAVDDLLMISQRLDQEQDVLVLAADEAEQPAVGLQRLLQLPAPPSDA